MISKDIEFEDYNGNIKKKTYYFHMNESEVVNWMSTDGDYTLKDAYDKMVENRNGKEIMEAVEDLITRSYGEKSLDGESFLKTPEITMRFKSSPAYSKLFMELLTDSKKAADFFNGIMPRSMIEKLADAIRENPDEFPEDVRQYYLGTQSSNKVEVLK